MFGRRSLRCSAFPGRSLGTRTALLVPRLCLGTGCLGGSASRVILMVAVHDVRQAEPAVQCVPRLCLGTRTRTALLVPRLCLGTGCLGGSASRVDSDSGVGRCSAGGACGAVRSQAGAWERERAGRSLGARSSPGSHYLHPIGGDLKQSWLTSIGACT
jgi:hypothetical protein